MRSEEIGQDTVGSRLAVLLLIGAAATSSWTGLYVGPLKVVDLLLLCSAFAAGPSLIRRFCAPPRWICFAAAAVAIVAVFAAAFPTSPAFLATRISTAGLVAPTSGSQTVDALQWLVALFILPAIVLSVQGIRRNDIFRMVDLYAVGAAVCAGVAISDYFGVTSIGPQLIGVEPLSVVVRQNGLADHVNNLGFAAAVAMPFGLDLARRHVMAGSAVVITLFGGAIVSGSRGAQVAIVFTICLTLFVTPSLRRVIPALVWSACVISILVLMMASDFLAPFGDVLRFNPQSGASQSDEGRALLAQQALRDFIHSPFVGIGFNALTSAHSVFLQILASGGIVLGLGMMVFWRGCIAAGLKLRRDGIRTASPFLVFVSTWLVLGAVENSLIERYLYFPVAAIVALYAQKEVRINAEITGFHKAGSRVR